jgi:hypothetical protein
VAALIKIAVEEGRMPRIFDNIEKELLPAFQETIKLFDRAGKHVI